ncbi:MULTISPECIES: aminotransferase-like domain-containing protein [Gammaproteobacteria]|uniref:aminotransferase-like domain-containing protein n=1 Tax=Gammaproteobacteria TaxID=1236 RepID=UPI0015F402D5|nr:MULTISPECIES: PLP-dependent aminotransferase family protein [Gammaproteobacteria]
MKIQESVLSVVSALIRQYPDAYSFSLGRPNPEIYAKLDLEHYLSVYKNFLRKELKYDDEQILEHVYTYGPSQGVINTHVAKWLKNDEDICASEKDIIITNGCQEAYNLVLLHELRQPEEHVLIIEPSYFGFTDCVAVLGKPCVKVSVDDVSDSEGRFNFELLHIFIKESQQQGKKIKVIYINPDFNNPMTYQLSNDERSALLSVCRHWGIKIIEDSTYSSFYYNENKPKSIKTLDDEGVVYYIGSFSKTLCPSLRLGYLVISAHSHATFDNLLHIKDHTSLSSSALSQHVVAGFLIEHQYSLENWVRPIRDEYRVRRDAMLHVLEKELNTTPVSWITPAGGFFVYIRLPQHIDTTTLVACAETYQVTFLPVSYYVRGSKREIYGMRLAFSYYPPSAIAEGTKKICQFLKERLLN